MCRQVLSAKLMSRNLGLENLAVSLAQQRNASSESSSSTKPSAPSLDDIVDGAQAAASDGSEIVTVQVEIEDSVAIETHDDNAPLTVILPPEAES